VELETVLKGVVDDWTGGADEVDAMREVLDDVVARVEDAALLDTDTLSMLDIGKLLLEARELLDAISNELIDEAIELLDGVAVELEGTTKALLGICSVVEDDI